MAVVPFSLMGVELSAESGYEATLKKTTILIRKRLVWEFF